MEKDLKLFWRLLPKLNYVLERKRKRMSGGVFVLIFIGALMETLGVCHYTFISSEKYFFKFFRLYSDKIQIRFRTGMGKELQRRMMSSYMKQSYSFFLDTSSGNIVQGIMGDVPKVQNFVENLMIVLSEMLVVLLIIFYLFRRDKLITIGIMAVALLTFLIMGLGLKKDCPD